MATFAVSLGFGTVPVVADDFAFETVTGRAQSGQPMPSRVQALTFTNYNGVNLSGFLADAGAAAPAAQVVAADYWIPSKNVHSVHTLTTGAASAGVATGTQTKNVFMVIPRVRYEVPYTIGATTLDRWPLFVADEATFEIKNQLTGTHTRAQGSMSLASQLTFSNYRGRLLWSQLAAPGALPAIITGQGDYFFPVDEVAALFRIRNQLWV